MDKPYTEELVRVIRSGGVAVIPTDTIYGVVGRYDSPTVLDRIRQIKKRPDIQGFIVLCADIDQLESFDLSEKSLQRAAIHWPGKVSIIFNPGNKFPYIQGDPNEMAFRIPDYEPLRKLLKKTGPLVAPSANPRAEPPSMTIAEAKTYFGDSIDCYIDGGRADSKPSKLIKMHADGTEEVLRD